MRTIAFILSLAIPAAAMAETPQDVARQIWPHGAPAYTGNAPSENAFPAGAATGRDLSRLLWPLGTPAHVGVAPHGGSAYAGTFTPADLVRLRGDGVEAIITAPNTVVAASPQTRLAQSHN